MNMETAIKLIESNHIDDVWEAAYALGEFKSARAVNALEGALYMIYTRNKRDLGEAIYIIVASLSNSNQGRAVLRDAIHRIPNIDDFRWSHTETAHDYMQRINALRQRAGRNNPPRRC